MGSGEWYGVNVLDGVFGNNTVYCKEKLYLGHGFGYEICASLKKVRFRF